MTTRIVTPDQRLRVFISSTLGELAPERAAVRQAVEALHLTPVLFELGARPHPPRELYRAYLDQSHVFVGIYWQRYGWVAPGEEVSGLEDEYRLAGDRPRLLYLKEPAPEREPRLDALVGAFQADDLASYRSFTTPEELARLVADDLAVLLSERFADDGTTGGSARRRARRHLPVPLTETIGRDAEIAEVASLLRGGRRLVTLTGPGGVGKSRLALEAARAAEADRDAVHLVALATARSADAMVRLVADHLGVPVGDAAPAEALAAALAGRRDLLVLDNLEQVDGAGPAVADLLERTPELQVLGTSRQALRVRGEWEHPVAPLPVPSDGATGDDVRANPAVALFAARAAEVSRRPVLDAANLEAVAEVARRLDGLPLAIELAAAQVRLLAPADLLERLDPLDVATPAGDRPDRQQTLRATLEWSHDLLTPDEQALFARLGTFDGGFTLDAAVAVAGGDEVLTHLSSLLDKSLVATDQDEVAAAPRFHLLEVVRAFALERLADRGELDELRRRHLAWARTIAHEAQPGLCGPGQTDWVAAMAPERANLRRAVETAFELGDVAGVVDLTWDVVVLYFVRDDVGEPAGWLRRAGEAIRGGAAVEEVTAARARSLGALTRIHHGDYDGVRDDLLEPLATFRREGMDFETAVVLHQVGFVRFHLDDDPEGAAAALEESSRLFDAIGHDWGVGLAESMLGSLHAALGDLAAARAHQERSLERARRIGSEQQEAQALGQLALVALLEERDDEALAHLAAASPILQRGHLRTDCANALDAVAVVAHQRGKGRTAAAAVAAARAERARLGIEPWPTLRPFVDRIAGWVEHTGGTAPSPASTDPFGVLAASLAALGPAA